jgi:signal transduction histidine kinase
MVAVLFVVTPAVGTVVALRQPRNTLGWLLLATGLVWGIVGAGSEYAELSEEQTLWASTGIGWVATLFIPSIAVLGAVLVPLLFPDGRLLSHRWRPAVLLAGVTIVVGAVGYAVRPGPLDLETEAENPFGISGAAWVLYVAWTLLAVGILIAASSLVLRFRRARGEERQQLKWFAYAGALVVPAMLGTMAEGIFGPSVVSDASELAFWSLILFVLPVAIGVAILRYRLWDIDVVIQRSLVYGLLWLVIAGIYLGASLSLGLAASSRVPVWLAVGVTVLATLLFTPARRRLEGAAGRWVLGRREQPLDVVHSFGEHLGRADRATDIASELARAVTGALPLTWLQVQGDGVEAIEIGSQSERPVARFPLAFGDERLGQLLCQLPPGRNLSADESATLAALARQAAMGISRAHLASRIVRAQETERRRIERNIHDGAQQEIVALVAKLGLARNQNGDGEHGRLLEELQDEARSILVNLRELAQGVHPSVLTDGGLVVAVEDRCSRLPILVDLDVSAELRSRRLPTDIEATAYYLVTEGLANLLRHSGASRAGVVLRLAGERLEVAVTDDGCGFEPGSTPREGGLQGLADRLEAIGGSLEIASSVGRGARVAARLPLRAGARV